MLRTPVGFVRGTAIALLIGFAPVHSLAAKKASSETSIEALDAGEYVWHADRVSEGPVELVVDLGDQLAYAYQEGRLIGATTISSGKSGHDTPIGRFEILQKRKEHYSNRYNSAPMPYMQRLTWSGVALHGGHVPGYPASHGWVRLPMKFAQKLYGVTELGTSIYIMDDVPSSPEEALAMARTIPDYQPSSSLASAAP